MCDPYLVHESAKLIKKYPIKISVLVPFYNVEHYLQTCLQSIVEQTYTDFEVLLIDDASTDRSRDIAQIFCDQDSRFRLITNKENTGQMRSYTRALQYALGEFICFVDSDDAIDPEYLYKLMQPMSDEDCDISVCTYREYGKIETNRIHSKTEDSTSRNRISCPFDDAMYKATRSVVSQTITHEQLIEKCTAKNMSWIDVLSRGFFPNRWTKMYRRSLLEQVVEYNNYDIRMFEDVLVVYPALLCARKIVVIPDALYCYRVRSGSTSRSGFEQWSQYVRIMLGQLKAVAQTHGLPFNALVIARQCFYALHMIFTADVAWDIKMQSLLDVRSVIKSYGVRADTVLASGGGVKYSIVALLELYAPQWVLKCASIFRQKHTVS